MVDFDAMEASTNNPLGDCWTCQHRSKNYYWAAGYCDFWDFTIEYPLQRIIGLDFDLENPVIEQKPYIESNVGCSEWKKATRQTQLVKRLRSERRLLQMLVEDLCGVIRKRLVAG